MGDDDKLKSGRGITLPTVEFWKGQAHHVRFNPYVSGYAFLVIWFFIIYSLCAKWQAYKEWQMWFQWVTDEWTWLYIGSQNVWIALLFYLGVSKYGSLKFGGPDAQPDFSYVQWFAMLYCCGVAVGLFYYSVAEPIWHYHGWGDPRWGDADMSDNEKATHALMVTYFHWGVHGWVPYVVIGALISLMTYRRGLPMTMRSCFYPLWGKGIEGWRGDLVDVLSIICTMFGVCTSLGLGVRQLNAGLVRLDKGRYVGRDIFGAKYDNPPRKAACQNSADCHEGMFGIDFNVKSQVTIIWCVTFLATASVVAGLKRGIATLSYVAFGMGMILVLSVLFMDDTMFILDSITTSFGYYLWWLPRISWETDAWARLGADHTWSRNGPGKSAGMVIQGDKYGAPDGEDGEGWMHSWTIFYWGWWISWAPFVGTFLAKISKGRTLREFIVYTLVLPTLYCVFWFGVFGSAGIKMQYNAAHDSVSTFSETRSTKLGESNAAYTVNLYSLGTEDILFDQLGSYGSRQLSYCLTGFGWICLLLYFITSSDSGSYVIDILGANGHQNPPVLQRIFWALTEGACATALLVAAGENKDRALKGVQAVSVVAGLPFTVILMYMSHALYIACLEESGDLDERRPSFRTQCLAVPDQLAKLPVHIFAPFVTIWKVLTVVEPEREDVAPVAKTWTDFFNNQEATGAGLSKPKQVLVYTALSGVFFYFAAVLLILCPIEGNLRMISAAFYLAFAAVVTYTRYQTRRGLGIEAGDLVTDCCLAVLFYPLVLSQCEAECVLGAVGGTAAADVQITEKKPLVTEA